MIYFRRSLVLSHVGTLVDGTIDDAIQNLIDNRVTLHVLKEKGLDIDSIEEISYSINKELNPTTFCYTISVATRVKVSKEAETIFILKNEKSGLHDFKIL